MSELSPLPFSKPKTLVIVTGGTIEALYSHENGTPYIVPQPSHVEGSAISEALTRLGLHDQCDVLLHSMHDSKLTKPEDVYGLLDAIEASGATEVVFVCGTDAMPAIGRYFQALVAKRPILQQQLKIVLTGAMRPLRNEHGYWRPESDGWENLQRAVEAAQNEKVAAGVYVEMGQGLMDPSYLIKQVEPEWKEGSKPGERVQYVAHSGFVKTKERQCATDMFAYPQP